VSGKKSPMMKRSPVGFKTKRTGLSKLKRSTKEGESGDAAGNGHVGSTHRTMRRTLLPSASDN